jgi:hypothetical protein
MKKMMYLLSVGVGMLLFIIPSKVNAQNFADRAERREQKREWRERRANERNWNERHADRDRTWSERRMNERRMHEARMNERRAGVIDYDYDYNYYNYSYYPTAALPVLQGDIPSDVISTFKNAYGPDLYQITLLKRINGQDAYIVQTINKDGVMQSSTVSGNNTPVQQ